MPDFAARYASGPNWNSLPAGHEVLSHLIQLVMCLVGTLWYCVIREFRALVTSVCSWVAVVLDILGRPHGSSLARYRGGERG